MRSLSPVAFMLAVLACSAFAQRGASHGGAGVPAGHPGVGHAGAGVSAGHPMAPLRMTPPAVQRPNGLQMRPSPVGPEPARRPGMLRFGSSGMPGTSVSGTTARVPYGRTPYGGFRHGPTGSGTNRDHDRNRGRDGDRDHRRDRDRERYWGRYGTGNSYEVVGWPGYYNPYLWSPLFGYSDNDGSSWDPDNYTGPIPEYGAQPAYPQTDAASAGNETTGSPYEYRTPFNGASSGSAYAMPGGNSTSFTTRPPYTGTVVSNSSAVAAPQHTVTVVFKDGRPSQQIHNYLLTRSTLTVLDQRYREIPLTEIDVPATEEANRAEGVDFRVPAGTK